MVNYTASHDEVRPEHEIKFYSAPHIARPKGMSVKDAALALRAVGWWRCWRRRGVPMLYAGQEYGDDSPRTIDFVPMQWQKLGRDDHAAHFRIVHRLIEARRLHARCAATGSSSSRATCPRQSCAFPALGC